MIRVEGYKLLAEHGTSPSDIHEAYQLAQDHNRQSQLKIKIFRTHQPLNFTLTKEDGLGINLKGNVLDTIAIEQIISHQYLVLDYQLFFFDDGTASFVKKVIARPSPTALASLLRQLPPNRRPEETELQRYLEASMVTDEVDSNIKLTVNLYPYQKVGLDWLQGRFIKGLGSILADDMGLGKTAQVIALIAERLRRRQVQKVLVVVPNSLIANWLTEFAKFTQGIHPYVHWGPERVGFSQSLDKEHVVITTYSTITNDLSLFQEIFFDLAVFDEASLLKNPDSMRTQAINQVSCGCSIAITGTPFENSMMDLWSISNVVSADFLGSRESFTREYVAQGVQELEQFEIDEVEELVRPILLRRMKSEVLKDLPSKIDIYKPLSMGERERKNYEALEQSIRESKHDKAKALALISHLRKFSAHPLLSSGQIDGATFEEMINASSKFSYLATALKTIKLANEKALIFANHVALLDKLVDCFSLALDIPCWKIDGSVADRQSVIDDFTATESAAFLFLNPITTGMGLNITAANHVFHYSRQWNPALEEQATARAYRNGQEKEVNAYYLYYSDSVEQTIHERIMTKSEIAGDVIKRTQFSADEDELIMSLI